MSTGHQSPQSSLPPFALKTINTTTWGLNGNTSAVVVDEYCHPNSMIFWHVYGTTPQSGFWSLQKSQGSFYFVSSDSENTALTIAYIII